MKKSLVFLWFTCLSFSCVDNSLNNYASELRHASRPTSGVKSFVEKTKEPNKISKMAMLYRELLIRWSYVPDAKGNDSFKSAGEVFDKWDFTGDCEDFSAAMMAICREMKLGSFVCLGQYDNKGHAWLEIRVAEVYKMPYSLQQEIRMKFGKTVNFVERDGYYWLQLSLFDENSEYGILELNNYTITHRIDTSGILYPVKK